MNGLVIESLAVLFQSAATMIAFRLLPVARRNPAVLLIITTGMLMLIRRIRILFYILSGNILSPFETNHELLALAVSIGLFGSLVWIVPRLISLIRTRDELKEKHSTASQVIRDLPIPSFAIDLKHNVTHWNSACERLTGVSATDMIGTREQWRAFYLEQRPLLADLIVDEAPEEEIRKYYGEAFSRPENIKGGLEAEFYLPAINGGRWLYFTATPLHDSEGHICGAIETFQDTTNQRKSGFNISRSASRLRTMHDLVQEIAFEKSVASLLNKTVKLLEKKMSFINVSIFENIAEDRSNDVRLRISASSSLDSKAMEKLSCLLNLSGKGISVKAARERKAILTPDVAKSPDYVPFSDGAISEIDVPIVDEERVLGVISAEGLAPFDSQDSELFSILAGHLSSLWRTIEILKQMETQALTDKLTGLPNRRALFERLALEEGRLLRYGGTMSIVMMDMAHFKEINDTYGHPIGDAVLKASARFISEYLRSCDFAARFGGDEFVILLPETSPEKSGQIIERIASGLSKIRVRGMPLELSADFGVASFPEDGKKLEDILRNSDDRMYEMKKGRV